jgi:uncharacterized membrane protein
MRTRVRIPLLFLIWVIIGVLVAVNNGYDRFDNADQIFTFVLAVILWPILATSGDVAVHFGLVTAGL